MSAKYRIFSFGGGVQSTAILIMQIMGRLPAPYDAFVFANVGEKSEKKATIDYFRNITMPLAKKHGIVLIETIRSDKVTLYDRIMSDQKSVVMPAYTRRNGGILRRNCTTDFKIEVVDEWIKTQYGAGVHVTVGLGISLNEYDRARSTDEYAENGIYKSREYPLLDLRLTRQDCINLIENYGLPVPEPSKCVHCPHNTLNEWIELRQRGGEEWKIALDVDTRIRDKESSVQGRCYLHRWAIPLEKAVGEQHPLLADERDESSCMDQCDT